jgi:predicted phage terminase large subunit-like protein
VLERVRMKTNDSSIIENAMIDMYSAYSQDGVTVTGFGVEEGQIWKTMKASLKKRMAERKVYIPMDDKQNILQPVKDKMVRARPLQGRMQNSRVTFPRGKAWVDEMITEFVKFPSGAQDDQIDSLAWAVTLAIRHAPPKRPTIYTKKPELTVEQKIKKLGRANTLSHMAA